MPTKAAPAYLGLFINACQVTEGEKIRKGGLEGDTAFIMNLGGKISVTNSKYSLLLKEGDFSLMAGK